MAAEKSNKTGRNEAKCKLYKVRDWAVRHAKTRAERHARRQARFAARRAAGKRCASICQRRHHTGKGCKPCLRSVASAPAATCVS